MLRIVHRVNTIEDLKKVPPEYGVEVDIRAYKDRLVLHHDSFQIGEDFEEYLKQYKHAFIILDIKEIGTEKAAMELCHRYGIHEYFLLDVEFPYLYKSTRGNEKQKIAVRYSEAEPIEQALLLKGKVEWVWIDVNTKLPLDSATVEKLKGFKTCLVSPECWRRPDDIAKFQEQMRALNFTPDAVMADLEYIDQW